MVVDNNNYYWVILKNNSNYYYSHSKLFVSSQECFWRNPGSDVCVAGQPAWTNLISSTHDVWGRPCSTSRGSPNSVHEDLGKEMPKVPHYRSLSSTKAFRRQTRAFTVKGSSNPFGAGVGLPDAPFFRKFRLGRISLVLCRELVSLLRLDLSMSQSHKIRWPFSINGLSWGTWEPSDREKQAV